MIAGIGAAIPAFVRPDFSGGHRHGGVAGPDEAAPRTSVSAPPVAGEGALPAGQRVEQAADSTAPKGADGEPLSQEQQQQVKELKQRDQEVRAHEQAHAAAGGPYASPPSFEFTTGPDGKRYAVSGEVQIDASPVRDNPQATLRKMDVVVRAALAPADPSSQDLQVARQAQAERAQAQADLARKREAERKGGAADEAAATTASASAAPLTVDLLQAFRAYAEGAQQGGHGARESGAPDADGRAAGADANPAADIFATIARLDVFA